jgi:hypothetical protein
MSDSTGADAGSAADVELTGRFESELSRARDVVVAVEEAASNVGLTTATTGGRIQCDYDLGTDDLVCRSISFELEF